MAGAICYRNDAAVIERQRLQRVRDIMSARGPDGAGLWLSDDARVGLAHRRLSIIDLSPSGAQPMLDAQTGNLIVFNGEIYNYRELRDYLHGARVDLQSTSDTEVVLKLYALHGPAMLGMLRGMYAIAIWSPASGEMFLARDPVGIKPLYYADDGKSLWFASQVRALLAVAVDTRPDPAGHAGYFLWGSVPEPWTLYRGVKALLPGHFLHVRFGQAARITRFENLSARFAASGQAGAGVADENLVVKEVADAVEDSVRAHMVADVPVGVFLSAGMDSTMIAACAARCGDLKTVTLGFKEYENSVNDEAPLAQLVARSLGADHDLQRITQADFAADHERILKAMDQPSIDGVNVWFVAKAAARRGLKVVLSGLGGDELFASYPSFGKIPQILRMTSRFNAMPGVAKLVRHMAAPIARHTGMPKHAGLLEYGGTLQGAYLLMRGLFMPWEIAGLLGREMARDGLNELNTLAALARDAESISSQRLAISSLEMQWYMKNQLLRDADWAGMAHSLEIRVPLVDIKLFERVLGIPGFAVFCDKRSVARQVAPELPADIFARPKTGFSIPAQAWLTGGREKGARAWARHVYDSYVGADPSMPAPATRIASGQLQA